MLSFGAITWFSEQPPHEKAEGRLFHGRNFPVFASQKRQNGGVQPPKEKTWGCLPNAKRI
ncbi:MAG: hypothetical protein J6B77_02600, partial [Clostridia bacterium]|nr:hypothetical protein [Clostridia bacterium]